MKFHYFFFPILVLSTTCTHLQRGFRQRPIYKLYLKTKYKLSSFKLKRRKALDNIPTVPREIGVSTFLVYSFTKKMI